MNKTKNILIIGGSNFIGWNLLQKLSENPVNKIWVLNRGNKNRDYPSGVTHIISDRHNIDSLKTNLENLKFDIVYDMCGFNKQDISTSYQVLKHSTSHIVFISSAAVYLPSKIFPIKENFPKGKHPVWGEYGLGKLEAEEFLLEKCQQDKINLTILRPSYVYGENNPIHRERFLYERLIQHKPILIPNDGKALIQLGDVKDLVDELKNIKSESKPIQQIFNISSEEYISLNGLVELSSKILDLKPKIIYIDTKKYKISDREIFPFDNQTYFTDISKIKTESGFNPKINLLSGLTNAFNRYKNDTNFEFIVNNSKELDILNSL